MYGDARPLFLVTEIVLVGLILFVGYVLLKVREPWVRNQSLAVSGVAPVVVPAEDVTAEKVADEKIAAESEKEAVSDQDDRPKND